ncbi:hypothetical protein GCM10022226_83140 [Sphaerisporangium flaviroseum]|uniref:LPXTG cell wall anchor domain-containing protein n=1 Tax=Sphaerisporangium flaviroseum TaxID=509199 RepID=A0ABP7JK62_9ACTN
MTHPPTGGNHKVTKTPLGAAETGGGGQAGPDGRVFVVTGFLLTLAAATGLLLRRRTIPTDDQGRHVRPNLATAPRTTR